MLSLEDAGPPLDPGFDKLLEKGKVGKVEKVERRRKTSKQAPDEGKPKKRQKAQENHEGKGAEVNKDDDEEGEDETSKEDVPDDEKKEGDVGGAEGDEKEQVGDTEEKGKKERKHRPRSKAKAKAKKAGEKAGEKDGSELRDQSKSKKLAEIWEDLPSEIQDSFDDMSRSEQTEFVNTCIERKRGRLLMNKDKMWALVSKREEVKTGREAMKGYGIDEPRGKN